MTKALTSNRLLNNLRWLIAESEGIACVRQVAQSLIAARLEDLFNSIPNDAFNAEKSTQSGCDSLERDLTAILFQSTIPLL